MALAIQFGFAEMPQILPVLPQVMSCRIQQYQAMQTSDNNTFTIGTDPHFKFGNLTNSDNDLDAEYVVVEFNALVLNNTNNQSGQTRDNTFILMTGATPATIGNNSNTITVTVAEPVLLINKFIRPTAPV